MPETSTGLLWILVLMAAIWDVTERRIPNPLVAIGLLTGLLLAAWSGGFSGLGLALLGALLQLVLLVGFFSIGWMGGGDVKLMMVVGCFLGWRGGLHVLLGGTVLHGLVGLAFVLRKNVGLRLGWPPPDLKRIPHALGFAGATIAYTLGLFQLF